MLEIKQQLLLLQTEETTVSPNLEYDVQNSLDIRLQLEKRQNSIPLFDSSNKIGTRLY